MSILSSFYFAKAYRPFQKHLFIQLISHNCDHNSGISPYCWCCFTTIQFWNMNLLRPHSGPSFPCYKKVIVILLEYIVHTTKRKPIVIYKIYEVTYTQHDSIIYLAYLQTWMNMIGIHLNIYWKCNSCYNKWHNLKYWYVVHSHCVKLLSKARAHVFTTRLSRR